MSRGGSVTAVLAGLVLAETAGTILRAQAPSFDTIDLALTYPGAPLTVKQVEVRVRQRPDGSSTTEESTRILYRDHAGRVRSEQQGRPFVIIRDPIGRQVIFLLTPQRRAIRMQAPDDAKGVGFTGGSLGIAMPTGWKPAREDLPPRIIEGVECQGNRFTYVDPENPDRTAYQEQWASRSMGIIAVVSASIPGETFTARIENLVRGEPDPALFVIPPNYALTEAQELQDK